MISSKQFERTRFKAVMSHQAYMDLDTKVQAAPTSLPKGARLSTGDRFSESKGANLLQKVIVWWLKQDGHMASRNNTMGVPRQIKGRQVWTKAPGMKGSGDIYSLVQGLNVWWEVKVGKDRQSDHQKKFQAQVEKSGGRYFIVRTLDDFLAHYHEIFPPGNRVRGTGPEGSTASGRDPSQSQDVK